jgi:hypothetical protein
MNCQRRFPAILRALLFLKSFLVYPVAVANPIWIDADGDGKVAPAAPYRP